MLHPSGYQLGPYPPVLPCCSSKTRSTWFTCDRGANGGLAGSDVRNLSKSSRKCTVTGIDQHQINGLDIVQWAALVKTNHGYGNLIMNEYDYYGKGHTIHSSGQIEWNKNQVDERSVKVGGSQLPHLMATPFL